MKRIGIIGGMSFESTLHYYERINRQIGETARANALAQADDPDGTYEPAGEHVSADIVLRSVNFEEYCKRMESGDWQEIANMLSDEATSLIHDCHCDYVAIATNTMHKVAKEILSDMHYKDGHMKLKPRRIEEAQFVHIGDCVAEECIEKGYKRVAIIGTKTTMTEDFMKDRLRKHGLEVADTFTDEEITEIDRIIFEELCHGVSDDDSKHTVLNAIVHADSRDMDNGDIGFDAVILGCTELEMLFDEEEEYFISNPKHHHRYEFVNSTQAHINKLVELCLS